MNEDILQVLTPGAHGRFPTGHLGRLTAMGCLVCLCFWGCRAASSDDETQPLTSWNLRAAEADRGSVVLPVHLPDDKDQAEPGYTLSARVRIRDNLLNRHLWLIIPTYDGSARLFVNNSECMPRQDPPGWRHHGSYRWYLGQYAASDAPLQIEIRTSGNFIQARWMDTVPLLSPEPDTPVTRAIYFVNDRLALIAIGLMAQVSVVCCVLYYMRRQRQYLYFAFEALGASAYDFDLLGLSGHVLGPYDIAWVGAWLCIASLMSIYFLYAHFDLGRPPRAWRVIFVFALLCWVFARSRGLMLPLLVLLSLAPTVFENLRVCLRLILQKKHRLEASILLVAWLVLTVSVVGEFYPWLGGGEVFAGLRPGGAGLGLFAVVLCCLLTAGYGEAMQQTEGLNKELKRQIKDRSRQMYSALAIAGGEIREIAPLVAGQLIQNRYRVVQSLGRGGMGAVYEVVRLNDNTPMALKVTRHVDGKALSRLAKEAELGVQVQDAHVVTMSDVDVADEGFIYIVMELVRGPPLEACRAALLSDVPSVLLILKNMSLGLHALHQRGIVHRDLKPANVLTNYPWTSPKAAVVKIADFGISRIEGPRAEIYEPPVFGTNAPLDEHHTVLLANRMGSSNSSSNSNHGSNARETEAATMGTPRYMAPELALGGRFITPAADMFSFGIVAYELLTGNYPFETPPVLRAAQNKSFKRSEHLQGDNLRHVPDRVIDALQRTLAWRVHERPTARDLAIVLGAKLP